MYADDTVIFASSWNHEKAIKYIQEHLDKRQVYFHNWKLTNIPTKTQAITFTKKRITPTDQKKAEHYIPWTPIVKYLGQTS